MKRYLYLCTQEEVTGYDTYDAKVICAHSVEDASKRSIPESNYRTWATKPESVVCALIGVAEDGVELGEVLGSFNAG